MTDKEKKYLSDILSSINHISSFTKDNKSFHQYKKIFLVKGAVERHLAIIGEAVNKFLKLSQNNDLEQAKQIISLRNRLIHAYDSVDDRIIWTIINRHIDPLKVEVTKLIAGRNYFFIVDQINTDRYFLGGLRICVTRLLPANNGSRSVRTGRLNVFDRRSRIPFISIVRCPL